MIPDVAPDVSGHEGDDMDPQKSYKVGPIRSLDHEVIGPFIKSLSIAENTWLTGDI